MLAQLHKRKWLAVALLVALSVVALWCLPSAPPSVRVTFQHTTNDPGNGKVGVIEVVNNLNETVVIMHAWYVPANRKDFSLGKDTPSALISDKMWEVGARSTNTAPISIPAHGGPYRLAVQCIPDSRSPWRNEGRLRSRFANLVFPWLHPSQKMAVGWYGGAIVATPSIDLSQ
jgi:hypothetical protein